MPVNNSNSSTTLSLRRGQGEVKTANGSATYKPNEYLYNGKMMQDEMGLGWYDYGASPISFFYTFAKKLTLGRIVAIDYGQKRVGLAVTDELRMIAVALTTVHSKDIIIFLKDYVSHENVDCFVVGYPLTMQNQLSESARFTEPFVKHLQRTFPNIPVERMDERFTSKIATAAILESGAKKKDRQNKALVDKVSAVIILQSYMEMKAMQR